MGMCLGGLLRSFRRLWLSVLAFDCLLVPCVVLTSQFSLCVVDVVVVHDVVVHVESHVVGHVAGVHVIRRGIVKPFTLTADVRLQDRSCSDGDCVPFRFNISWLLRELGT
jgi:hypothetical protein